MHNRIIGVLGATSFVGKNLLSQSLLSDFNQQFKIKAFTRRSRGDKDLVAAANISWVSLTDATGNLDSEQIDNFICLSPIWVLADYYSLFEKYGVKRIVVLSSTSRFTKVDSPEPDERETTHRLIEGEKKLIDWAQSKNIEWIILRPTLIYGDGRDKNIMVISNFIKRFGFFPLIGPTKGLRQPLHARDVAKACMQALLKADVINKDFNISGGETVNYKEMVKRIFNALGKKPIFIPIPAFIFNLAIWFLSKTGLYRKVSLGMSDRLNVDLVFDHSAANDAF